MNSLELEETCRQNFSNFLALSVVGSRSSNATLNLRLRPWSAAAASSRLSWGKTYLQCCFFHFVLPYRAAVRFFYASNQNSSDEN